MMNWTSRIAAATLLTALMAVSQQVAAAPGGVSPMESQLGSSEFAALEETIEHERRAHPKDFDDVEASRATLPRLAHHSRGRLPAVSPMLKRMGRRTFYPLVAEVLHPPSKAALGDRQWLAWSVGVLEALGALRDPRLSPLLRGVMLSATDSAIVEAAIAAYAAAGTDEVAAQLVALSRPGSMHRDLVLSRMGHCRRSSIAAALDAALHSGLDESTSAFVVRSLGDVGALWVWQSATVPVPSEFSETQDIATRSLVRAYAELPVTLRPAIKRALAVTANPNVSNVIDAQKTLTPGASLDLDTLKRVLESSRIR